MNCKCNIVEIVLAIVILIFAFVTVTASKWIIAVAAILLGLHSLTCKNCRACAPEMKPVSNKSARSSRRRK